MSGSGTSTPGAGPSSQTLMDPYRPLASAVQRPLAPFLPPGSAPEISQILGLSEKTFSDRVEGKTLLLDDKIVPKTSSAVLTGRKLHGGDTAARASARADAEGIKRKRTELGLVSMRKARKRGGTVNRGGYIDYNSLLPLHHLHTLYLISILSLHPLPHSLPTPLPPLPPGCSSDGIASKLLKADFTGIILTVLASRNRSLAGLSGIVIEETGATFRLVPKDGKVRVIPKEATQFGLSFPAYAPAPSISVEDKGKEVERGEAPEPVDMSAHLRPCPRIEITLLGTNFGYRSGDRAGRRFKLAQGQAGNGWGEDWVKSDWDGVFAESSSKGKARERRFDPHGMEVDPKVSVESSKVKTPGESSGENAAVLANTETVPRAAPLPTSAEPAPKKTKSDNVIREKGMGQEGMRKKGKSRRKDPFAGGSREAIFQ